ncbi:MAG: hypothetical protein LBC74_04270 [Planctomycetaceae bacterium]|jgi:hypothetical protein|nr:hypothetical protein [Planctomycetaceae bacterium]
MNLYIVAKDSRLLRWVRIVDVESKFNIVRVSQLHVASERARRDSDLVVLVDWRFAEVAEGIRELGSRVLQKIRSRFFICVNDMQLLSPSEAEFIYFALLQTGVGGVFSQVSELNLLTPVFARYSKQSNTKKQNPFKSAWDSLPWKKHAVKLEYTHNNCNISVESVF